MVSFNKAQLEEMICEMTGQRSVSPIIAKHVQELILIYDMTYLEIARCLTYLVEVANGKISVIYGIRAQVLSIRELSEQYFRKLELDQQRQLAEAAKIVEYQDNNIIFNIESLEHKKRQPKQLDISEIDVSGGSDGVNQ